MRMNTAAVRAHMASVATRLRVLDLILSPELPEVRKYTLHKYKPEYLLALKFTRLVLHPHPLSALKPAECPRVKYSMHNLLTRSVSYSARWRFSCIANFSKRSAIRTSTTRSCILNGGNCFAMLR